MFDKQPFLMKNTVQNYEWGTRGTNAFIPELLGMEPENDKPYAELWMGAHPKAPSQVLLNGEWQKLSDVINQYPQEMLGEKVFDKFGSSLPFLFKVLSAGEPLSIQAHPSKQQAEILHKNDPEHYPDDNHKPEIAVALDQLKALLGFKKIEQIREVVQRYVGFAEFTDNKAYNNFINPANNTVKTLKNFYSSIMLDSRNQPERFKNLIDTIKSAITAKNMSDRQEAEQLFIKMFNKYGYDIGLISILFFNLITLKKGEAIFTPAGIPHAYLGGNIIECMANSDNVIRAGLTPKFQDVDNLLSLIDYSDKEPEPVNKVAGQGIERYLTFTDEFEVSRIKSESGKELSVDNTGPSVIIILSGEIVVAWENSIGRNELILRKGNSLFIPAILKNYKIFFTFESEIYRAGCIN